MTSTQVHDEVQAKVLTVHYYHTVSPLRDTVRQMFASQMNSSAWYSYWSHCWHQDRVDIRKVICEQAYAHADAVAVATSRRSA